MSGSARKKEREWRYRARTRTRTCAQRGYSLLQQPSRVDARLCAAVVAQEGDAEARLVGARVQAAEGRERVLDEVRAPHAHGDAVAAAEAAAVLGQAVQRAVAQPQRLEELHARAEGHDLEGGRGGRREGGREGEMKGKV